MSDELMQLRRKAEACRQLAEIEEMAERKALWIERAQHWEQLAANAERNSQPAKQT